MMKKVEFFYNYTAIKQGVYNKFNCGTFGASNLDGAVRGGDAFKALYKDAKEMYPDAESIDVTAFNRI